VLNRWQRIGIVLSILWVLSGGIITSATSANAEAWTCTYTLNVHKENEPFLDRFIVSPPDMIETKYNKHYQILRNNEYGLVATNAISAIEQGQERPTVGADTVVIVKASGEFWWGTLRAGPYADVFTPVRGKCIKD
jgi:hypothetical protein